jgi:hypothetical protein
MEEGLFGDDQFDFDGASKGSEGGEAGFGAGWEDDLETMLLKGMKKKAQRRIAMMTGMGVVGVLVGALLGYGVNSATQPPVVVQGGCTGADCKGCRTIDGVAHYAGWNQTCSGGPNVDCDGCYGGTVPNTQRDACPHTCICTVRCDPGWDVNVRVVGEDGLYAISCHDGAWLGEEQCGPGSPSCTDAHGNALPEGQNKLCLDHNDCTSNPCQHGADCVDGRAPQKYTCNCHPGFSGENCEVDEDECLEPNGYTDATGTMFAANPCNLQVRACFAAAAVCFVSIFV